MINGLLILVATFLVLLVLNYFSIRAFKLPKHKRERLRKASLFVYALFLVFLGVLNLIFEDAMFFGWGQIVIGVAFFFANKYDRKRKNL